MVKFTLKKSKHWNFPGGPVVKNQPSNAGDEGSVPGQEAKIPHASWCNQKIQNLGASLVAQLVKNLLAVQETWVRSLFQEDPLEKEMQPTPVFLPGEFHGQRSLVGYSPQGWKESETTE